MKTIGIIGAGNIGAALTRLFTEVGHKVAVANSRGPESLRTLVLETGARAATVTEAAQASDIVVITVPMFRVSSLPPDLFHAAPKSQILIDTSNYYPRQRDGLIHEVESGMTESAWVEQQLKRPVIKVFNSILAVHLLEKAELDKDMGRVALPVAGDDAWSKTRVMQLVEEIGFDAVDAGTIEESWRQQPGSPLYLKDFDIAGVQQALAAANAVRTAEWRATPNSPGTFEAPA